MQAGQLRNKVEVYGMVSKVNSFGADSRKPEMLKKVWANIIPTSGQNREEQGNVSEIHVSHKITVRAKALKDISPEYYFMYKGQKYEILYWYPNYRDNNFMEIFCRLEVSV